MRGVLKDMKVIAVVCVALIMGACGPSPFSLSFAGVVGDEPFACGVRYDGVGVSGSNVVGSDLRFYVHDVIATTASGDFSVTLDVDAFQSATTALVDLEDGSGACNTGSPLVHDRITGVIDSDENVRAVSFSLGVAGADNHLDVATAEAPLNVPGMWWSWASGYRFMKADLLVGDDQREAFFHHGATTCSGDPVVGFSCAFDNDRRFSFDLDPASQTLAVDVGALYAGVDLDAPLGADDFVKGCMAFSADPECPPMFGALGLPFEDGVVVEAAPVFRVR